MATQQRVTKQTTPYFEKLPKISIPDKAFRMIDPGMVHNGIPFYPVFVTFAYHLLHFMSGVNRKITTAHVNMLGDSVEAIGVIRDVVVAYVKKEAKYFIVDGQNLATYFINTGAPVKFKLIESVETMADAFYLVTKMNCNALRFNIGDYVEGWANFYGDYSVIKEMKTKYGLNYSAISMLLSNTDKPLALAAIKRGDFYAEDLAGATRKLEQINRMYNKVCSDSKFERFE